MLTALADTSTGFRASMPAPNDYLSKPFAWRNYCKDQRRWQLGASSRLPRSVCCARWFLTFSVQRKAGLSSRRRLETTNDRFVLPRNPADGTHGASRETHPGSPLARPALVAPMRTDQHMWSRASGAAAAAQKSPVTGCPLRSEHGRALERAIAVDPEPYRGKRPHGSKLVPFPRSRLRPGGWPTVVTG